MQATNMQATLQNEGEYYQINTTSKLGRRKYYPSNRPQSFIRNAVTGLQYPFRVGSTEQRGLFKMVDTTGTYDGDGYKLHPPNCRPPVVRARVSRHIEKSEETYVFNLPNANTNHLFFDSPEQCASHLNLMIDSEVTNKWRVKNIRLP